MLFVITVTEAAEAGIGAGAAGLPPQAGTAARPPEWTGIHWRRLFRRLREVADWRLLSLGGALFAGVVAVSALLFLAIPRFELDSGFFLDRFMSRQSRTGFSDSIRLGDVVDIQEDNSVALRVDVSDPARIPAMPYWRMVVLDEYREGGFSTSMRLKNELMRSTRTTSFLRGVPAPLRPPVLWTFYLESGVSRFLPVGGPFARLQFREPQQVERHQQLWVFALRNEPVTMTAYRVDGMLTDGFIPDRLFGVALQRAGEAQRAARAGSRDHGGAARAHSVYPLTTLELPDRPADVAGAQTCGRTFRRGRRRECGGVCRPGAALADGSTWLLAESGPARWRPRSGGGLDGIGPARALRVVRDCIYAVGARRGISDANRDGLQGGGLERL